MSYLKDLREEWKRLGDLHRHTFRPTVSGTPAKIFFWWEGQTGKIKRPINFCHFFWTVVLWSPLLWLKLKVVEFINSRTGAITIASSCIALFIALCVTFDSVLYGFLLILAVAAAFAYLVGGFMLAFWVLSDLIEDEKKPGWYQTLKKNPTALLPAVALSTPMLIILALLASILFIGDTRWFKSTWHWYAKRQRFNTGFTLRGFTVFVVVIGLEVLFIWNGAWTVPISSLAILMLIGLVMGIGEITARLKLKRQPKLDKLRQQAEKAEAWVIATMLEPALQIMFEYHHPRKAGNQESFLKWKRRYFDYIVENYGADEWEYVFRTGNARFHYTTPSGYATWDRVRNTIDNIRAASEIQAEFVVEKQSGPIMTSVKAIGGTVGNFILLIWQMAVSTKKQICPLVEIKEG